MPEPIRLLTIEDDRAVRASISAFFRDSGFIVLEAEDGNEGLAVFHREHPDVVLTDLRMPNKDGLEVIADIRATNLDTPIIVLSGAGNIEDAIQAIRLGAWDYMTKPIFDMTALEIIVHRTLERARLIQENRLYQEHLEELVRQRTTELQNVNEQLQFELVRRKQAQEQVQALNAEILSAYDATLEGWSHALDLRDRETTGHSKRVMQMAVQLARTLGITDSELVHLRRGAILHDIGKMGVPDSILLKPGSLTDEEWRIMRLHPVYAYEMLSSIEFLKPALDIPHYHHEKWDGTGYPCGLKGDAIPFAARIFAVVDVWDALRSDRPYRKSCSAQSTFQYIQSHIGNFFDPELAEKFLMQQIGVE